MLTVLPEIPLNKFGKVTAKLFDDENDDGILWDAICKFTPIDPNVIRFAEL